MSGTHDLSHETMALLKADRAQDIKIIGHQFSMPALLSG